MWPGAAEVCNGRDDNCNGLVDEGCPTTAVLAIAPSERDFGDVQIQTEAPVQRFTVTNMGAGVSGLPSVALGGDTAFSMQTQCASQLGPGASCATDVTFRPQALGPASGVLSVSASPGSQVQAMVTGNGVCVPDGQPDLPDPSFLDTDCDGIDGSIGGGVFVDALAGDDAAAGTMDAPKRSLTAAIVAAQSASPSRDVYASRGVYMETVALRDSISLYGGFDAAAGWSRSRGNATTIQSPSATGVLAQNVSAAEVQLFRVVAASATGGAGTAGSSYGVRAVNATALVLRLCDIQAGDGAPGAPASDGLPGTPGSAAGHASGRSRGTGGDGCGGWGRGGAGGLGGFGPEPGERGAAGSGGSPTGAAGAAGGDGGAAGACSTTSSSNGGDAPAIVAPGSAGPAGWSGGAGAGIGTAAFSAYAPANGGSGAAGAAAGGGGGGGGGGGTASGDELSICIAHTGAGAPETQATSCQLGQGGAGGPGGPSAPAGSVGQRTGTAGLN